MSTLNFLPNLDNTEDFLEDEKDAFLDSYVFCGLKNLNTGFDVASIKYFSEKDFAIVLQRVKDLGLGVYGIEPWKNESFFAVETYEDYATSCTDPAWYMTAFENFKKLRLNLKYSASYHIPADVLNSSPLKDEKIYSTRNEVDLLRVRLSKKHLFSIKNFLDSFYSTKKDL